MAMREFWVLTSFLLVVLRRALTVAWIRLNKFLSSADWLVRPVSDFRHKVRCPERALWSPVSGSGDVGDGNLIVRRGTKTRRISQKYCNIFCCHDVISEPCPTALEAVKCLYLIGSVEQSFRSTISADPTDSAPFVLRIKAVSRFRVAVAHAYLRCMITHATGGADRRRLCRGSRRLGCDGGNGGRDADARERSRVGRQGARLVASCRVCACVVGTPFRNSNECPTIRFFLCGRIARANNRASWLFRAYTEQGLVLRSARGMHHNVAICDPRDCSSGVVG